MPDQGIFVTESGAPRPRFGSSRRRTASLARAPAGPAYRVRSPARWPAMADAYKAVPGGLKLKGGGVKKKKREPVSAVSAEAKAAIASLPADRRTASERAFEERQAKEELRTIAKSAGKTHREKVADFNASLAKLSEHHDIPRVGPG